MVKPGQGIPGNWAMAELPRPEMRDGVLYRPPPRKIVLNRAFSCYFVLFRALELDLGLDWNQIGWKERA